MLAALASPVPRVQADGPLEWPGVTRESRPWVYHWWPGSAVDPENIARELKRHHDAGLGGVHIVPIYSAKGAGARSIEFLSPRWMDQFASATREAERLGMGVDLTTGTGWCFGGPNVDREQGGWNLDVRTVKVPPGDELRLTLPARSWFAMTAIDQDGRAVDRREDSGTSRIFTWRPGRGGATVHTVTTWPGGPNVKRAAPGGVGPMLNPYDPQAMAHYLERFSAAFEADRAPRPRAMYHDSFEYGSTWAPGMLEAFARRRGYRLEDQLAAFAGDPATDARAARVRADFRETVSDLMVEEVFPVWTRWCRDRGMLTRDQAHGSPANLLDLYALADVPETETFGRGARDPLRSGFDERFGEGDRDPLICKFASSAAHVAGKPLTAAETGTWLAENYCETLGELKCLADLMFAAGVNHIFYHGCIYSPDDVAWPGWFFYAATQLNPRNPIWRDLPALNAHVGRCQAVLQSGRPDNDVALYWPVHDLWHTGPGLLINLGVHDHDWLEKQPVGASAKALWERGWGFDYVSDRMIGSAHASKNGGVAFPGGQYRVLLVPPTDRMPVPTLRALHSLARDGATVVFQDRLPRDVPGLADAEERRAALEALLAPLGPSDGADVRQVRLGRGRVVIGGLGPALDLAGVDREPLADHRGTVFIRRRHAEGRVYFIANQSGAILDGWTALATPARSVVVMDPLTGRTGRASMRGDARRPEVRLRLEPGHSVILRTFETRDVDGPAWTWTAPGAVVETLAGPWDVRFAAGGPKLPKPFRATGLGSWTTGGDPDREAFGGTAVYRTRIQLPDRPGPIVLDLGRVCHSARVRLDGRDLGTLLMPPYQVDLAGTAPGPHDLEVEVTNLPANRVRDLDRRKVPWKSMNDANLVDIKYHPFDAADWPILESGWLGPATLRDGGGGQD